MSNILVKHNILNKINLNFIQLVCFQNNGFKSKFANKTHLSHQSKGLREKPGNEAYTNQDSLTYLVFKIGVS